MLHLSLAPGQMVFHLLDIFDSFFFLLLCIRLNDNRKVPISNHMNDTLFISHGKNKDIFYGGRAQLHPASPPDKQTQFHQTDLTPQDPGAQQCEPKTSGTLDQRL